MTASQGILRILMTLELTTIAPGAGYEIIIIVQNILQLILGTYDLT